jgi:hypothetical protein
VFRWVIIGCSLFGAALLLGVVGVIANPPLRDRVIGQILPRYAATSDKIRCICQIACGERQDVYTGEHSIVDGKPACGCKGGLVVLEHRFNDCD